VDELYVLQKMRILLQMLFGWAILLNGSTFAAIQGRKAQALELTGSVIIPYIPWIALSLFLIGTILTRNIKPQWKSWICFFSIFIGASALTDYPRLLLSRGSSKIKLDEYISKDNRIKFEGKYGIPYTHYSSSSDGACILVRRDNYTEELADFVRNIVKKQQAEQVSAPNPLPAE
jgi:hypothetical protein